MEDYIAVVKAWLEGITNIGQVYDKEVSADQLSTIMSSFGDAVGTEKRIAAWFIGMGPCSEKRHSNMATDAFDSLVVRGYYSGRDASGANVNQRQLVASIRSVARIAIAADATLGDVVTRADYPTCKAQKFEALGPVVCHYVELTFPYRTQYNNTV